MRGQKMPVSCIKTIAHAGWNSLHSESLCVNMEDQPQENNNSVTHTYVYIHTRTHIMLSFEFYLDVRNGSEGKP